MRRRNQLGDSRIGCFLWLLVLAAFAYAAYQALPVKMKSANLEDFMTRQAERAGHATEKDIAARVLARATEIGLPVTEDDILVEKRAGRVIITCSYTVPISLVFYDYPWEFDIKVDRPVFII